MKNCGNKIKHTCAEKSYATCTYYEKELPDFSKLPEAIGCPTIEDTTYELYNLIKEIKRETDLSDLGEKCIDYDEKLTKSVLLQLEQEICDLKSEIEILKTTAICNADITHCTGLDLSGITNSCATPVTTLGELLDYLLNHQTTP
jgi:hypothetical protein